MGHRQIQIGVNDLLAEERGCGGRLRPCRSRLARHCEARPGAGRSAARSQHGIAGQKERQQNQEASSEQPHRDLACSGRAIGLLVEGLYAKSHAGGPSEPPSTGRLPCGAEGRQVLARDHRIMKLSQFKHRTCIRTAAVACITPTLATICLHAKTRILSRQGVFSGPAA